MAQIHGLNTKIFIWDSGGTSRDISADFNSVTLSYTRETAETTTFSDTDTNRVPGVRDAQLSGAGVWNSGASNLDSVMQGIMTASIFTLLKYYPGGCSTGCPHYTGCFLLTQYEITGGIAAPVAFNYTFLLGNGSLSASTV